MLTKQYVKSRDICKVTFVLPLDELPEGVDVHDVRVAGDFNEWDTSATPMKLSKKKKAYTATVELEPGSEYEFRYVLNGDIWYNDWAADAYAPGGIGDDNCVVLTPQAG